MKKVNFIGTYDKIDCIMYVAKLLTTIGKKVLVIDTTLDQRAKDIIPSITPTVSYVTEFEDIDVAVGFKNFENIKDYWYGQLNENASKNIVIGIAGNKCDLYEEEDVSENEAREFAEQIGAVFELTSAQNNTGINELFLNCGYKFLDPSYIPKANSAPAPVQKPQTIEENSETKQEVFEIKGFLGGKSQY